MFALVRAVKNGEGLFDLVVSYFSSHGLVARETHFNIASLAEVADDYAESYAVGLKVPATAITRARMERFRAARRRDASTV